MKPPRVIMAALCVAALILAIIWIALPGTIRDTFSAGKNELEEWVGGQILNIAADHLGVTLSFDAFDFESVDTIQIINASLVDDGVAFVTCRSLRVRFGEIPQVGKPIVIEAITLEEPVVRFLSRGGGRAVGWDHLIRSKRTGSQKSDGGSTRLSDVFEIRRIAVNDGRIEYDSGTGASAMIFDGIDVDLDVVPDAKGIYRLDAVIEREALARLVITGRLDLDRSILESGSASMRIALAEPQYQLFPPQVQSVLRRHEISGELNLDLKGTVPFRAIGETVIDGRLALSEGVVVFDEYILPIERLDSDFRIESARLVINSLTARLLGGSVELRGSAQLNEPRRADVEYSIDHVQLKRALRGVNGSDPKFAGLLNLDGRANLRLNDPLETLTTTGTVRLTEGKLVRLPVMSQLIKLIKRKSVEMNRDRVSATFEIAADRPRVVLFREIDVASGGIAARGEGELGFDGRIDFRINAGPLETVQNLLGEIGSFFGEFTDKLMKYRVTGTIRDPKVRTEVLGLGGT